MTATSEVDGKKVAYDEKAAKWKKQKRPGMDTGNGSFTLLASEVAAQLRDTEAPVFTPGEPIEIRGSKFTVENVGTKQLKLRLMARV